MKPTHHIIPWIVCFALLFSACDEFLKPDLDNIYTKEEILRDPSMAEGILLNVYSSVPNITSFNEVATDDAVSNDNTNNYRLASDGEWKSTNNAFNVWGGSYTNIAYINEFLSVVDRVKWSKQSEWQQEHFRTRLKAEAYALRALFEFRLLQAHSGYDDNNNLLGFPVLTDLISVNDNWQTIGRDTYADCVQQIINDLDSAIAELPDVYDDAPVSDILKIDKDAVYGKRFQNRINKRAAQLLKARVLLHAASPAFNPSGDAALWEAAANAAAVVINAFGGTDQITNSRIEFYLNENNPDILWRKDYTNSRNLETDHFPPSLYGNGRVNPTQNLVDAFPDINGYPIALSSTYNPAQPYVNRDPRLEKYILYNGSTFKGSNINTINDAKDGINMLAGASTRTGYYMKKWMNASVNLQPGNLISQRHFAVLMRYTEAFLIYAEAANEAWGPDGTGTHGYSARDVMAKLRNTAGIITDNYLPSIISQDDMRLLIRNERRLEMAFEGVRFWDIRRWNDIVTMKEPAYGTNDGGFTSIVVELRKYDDYMIYGPIPDSEFRKGLKQNAGWK